MSRIVFSCCFTALVVHAGCTGSGDGAHKTMRVWGNVSYDGKPIEDGTIDFTSTDGSPPAQAQIKGGRYDLPAGSGPVAGTTYRVGINALAKTGKKIRDVTGDGNATMDEVINVIPPAYNAESSLKAAISLDASKNQFDFKLDKPSAK